MNEPPPVVLSSGQPMVWVTKPSLWFLGSYQAHSSFGDHLSEPGKLLLRADTPYPVMQQMESMGYKVVVEGKTSGPINGIFIDQMHGTLMGGSSDYGDDYGVAW